MKNFSIILITIFTVISFAYSAEAVLYDRGGGLIYDDVLDITWLQHANYSGNTMDWDEAMNWAGDLLFQGFDDWRLPSSDSSCTGTNCTGSEMGYLFEMYEITSSTPSIFTDVKNYMYWSGTEDPADASKAIRFNFSTGYQGTSSKTYTRYAWAVRDGDSTLPVAPEPVSSLLFIVGSSALGVSKLLKKRTGSHSI